ncbi:MAG: ATP-binding protein [Prevotellaceae bacterium]|nr:ATP-binding protein [Prevotellaceae bacterium]
MNIPTRIFPIGIQNFEQLRTLNYVYVDKTDLIYQLTHTNIVYFLSRPRRFGKSLLISTLKAYFEGKKQLFDGLAMEQLEKDWEAYPVLHLSFATARYNEAQDLHLFLDDQLGEWEQQYGIDAPSQSYDLRFKHIIRQAHKQTGKEVVVLIDEYDAPLLDAGSNEPLRKELRIIMRKFFSPLKDCTEILRFLFITGITKFSQMSIFSELNSLYNISMMPQYATLCGITQAELLSGFQPEIEALAAHNEETYEEAIDHLKRMYDGYHFCDGAEGVYNPFSIINVLTEQRYTSYWYGTGTPTFLIELLRERKLLLKELEQSQATVQSFDRSTDTLTDPLPVLYQSGYLTIKGYRNGIYTLGYPNDEVRYGFLNSLLPSMVGHSQMESEISLIPMMQALETGDLDACLTRLRAFISSIPYELKSDNESRFETICYILFSLMGQFVQTQVKTAAGRADVVITNASYVYLFELKVDATPDEALAQIESKGYAIPYEAGDRTVVKVGVCYDSATRTITQWKGV